MASPEPYPTLPVSGAILLALLLVSSSATAAEPAIARRTAWIGLVPGTLSPLEAGALEDALVRALAKDERLLLVDAAGHPLGPVSQRQDLARADALRKEGVDQLLRQRFDAARERLEQAVLLFESQLLATADHAVLHDALLAEAEALVGGGQRQQAKTMLRRLAALKPTVVPTLRTHPRAFVDLWEEASRSLGSPGRLSISTDPPGAELIVDGVRAGRSPLELKGVLPGTHAVAAVLHDFLILSTVQVTSGKRAELRLSRKGPADDLKKEMLESAAARLGTKVVAERFLRVGTMASAEEALVAAAREEDGAIVLVLARHGDDGRVLRAASQKQASEGAGIGFDVGRLLEVLYAPEGPRGAVLAGAQTLAYPGLGDAIYSPGKSLLVPPELPRVRTGPDAAPTEVPRDELPPGAIPPPPPEESPSLVSRWWFWTIIGAVAVAGGGIAIAAAGRPAPTQTIIDVVLPSGPR